MKTIFDMCASRSRNSGGIWMALFIFLFPFSAKADENVELMDLSEVKPGMLGEWKTVVSGTKIETFPLEVIGVARNFIGPRHSVIICRALDDRNLVSGPVSGMSGSPVYIDGKLVGAYAYGFTWAKEQALIGVTPIGDMIEVWERYEPGTGGRRSLSGAMESPAEWTGEEWEMAAGVALPPGEDKNRVIAPLPTPLFVSGISPSVFNRFRGKFAELGIEVTSAPMGRGSDDMNMDLQPGSAVAAVLMSGDFNFAATGTVTYREGERVLAFGHPFFGSGQTEIPMAPAEVMTVVQSVVSSFKLSNPGPVVGSIYQDRLTAIAGEIGRDAPVTRMTIRATDERGEQHVYRGDLFEHPSLSPSISAMALAEALTQTMEASEEQTFYVRAEWDLEGFSPIVWEDVATGPNAAFQISMQHFAFHNRLLNHSYELPKAREVTFDIDLRDERLLAQLIGVQLDRTRFRAGEDFEVLLTLRNYRGGNSTRRVTVPVPADFKSRDVTLFIGDASAGMQRDEKRAATPTSFEQQIERMRRHQSRGDIVVKLIDEVPGLAVHGQSLPDPLPSVGALYQSTGTRQLTGALRHRTLWETTLTVDGVFQGSYSNTITIE